MLVDSKYFFRYFGLEVLYKCNQLGDGLIPKIPWENKKNSILRKVSKLVDVKLFSQLPYVGRF